MPRHRIDPKFKKAIGKRIEQALEARKMKQVTLADRVGVKPHTIWRYIEGQFMPGPLVMERIAAELGIPLQWLMRGGPTPPGLKLASTPHAYASSDASISQEEQLLLLDELGVSPQVRRCWSTHMAREGAHQKITHAYLNLFIEIAAQQLTTGASIQDAADYAGEFAFNAAVEAHAREAQPVRGRRRRRTPPADAQ